MNIQTINGCHNFGQPMNGRKWSNVREAYNRGRDFVVDTGKKAVDVVKNVGVAATFLGAREGLKQIIKFNILGTATILAYYRTSKPNRYDEILKVWDKFGGDKSTFSAFVNEGKGKAIRQVAPAVLNRFKSIKKMITLAYKINSGAIRGCKTFPSSQFIGDIPPPDPGTTATIISTALPIILEIINILKKDPDTNIDNLPDLETTGGDKGLYSGGGPDSGGDNGGSGEKNNTMLYLGLAAAAVGAFFIFSKK